MDDNIEREIAARKVKLEYKKLSLKYNVPIKEIEAIIKSPYKFTREVIRDVNVNTITDNKTKTNFLYKYLGKYYIDVNKLIKRNEKRNE